MRTQEITLPGFRHDICSAIHPLGLGSPFFRSLPLDQFGLAWVQPEIPLAHPLDDGTAVALHRSIDQTAASIGADGQAWAALMGPLAAGMAHAGPGVARPAAALAGSAGADPLWPQCAAVGALAGRIPLPR